VRFDSIPTRPFSENYLLVFRCCACPETKSARDECFLNNDPDTAQEACAELVKKHVECMRGYGFKI